MPNPEKNRQFDEFFRSWRGAEAADEEDVLAIAKSIYDGVTNAKLTTIKRNFNNADSRDYQAVSRDPRGSLLFGRIAVAEYKDHNPLTHEEDALLHSIDNTIREMYLAPGPSMAAKFVNLTVAGNQWLDNYALTNSNPAKAKALCLSLYTMVKIAQIALSNLPYMARLLASAVINLDDIEVRLRAFLEKAELTVEALDAQLVVAIPTPAAVGASRSTPADLQIIKNHLNGQFQAIFNQDNVPFDEKIGQTLLHVNSIYADLTALVAAKEKTTALIGQIKHAENVLKAVGVSRSTGQDTLSLIATHEASYNNLLSNSTSGAEKRELIKQVEQLRAMTPSAHADSELTSDALFATFAMFAALALNAFSTTHTPTKPPSIPVSVAREPDSTSLRRDKDVECKSLLENLATEQVIRLIRERDASNAEIDRITRKLAGTNEGTRVALSTAHSSTLTPLLAEKAAEFEALSMGSALISQITRNQKKLVEIAVVEKKINAFVQEHYTLGVWFSLVLSNLISDYFKSPKADKVEQALGMQTQLRQLSIDYTTRFSQGVKEISENPIIPSAVKTALRQLKEETSTIVARPSVRSVVREDYTSVFTAFRTQYNKIVPEDPSEPPPAEVRPK